MNQKPAHTPGQESLLARVPPFDSSAAPAGRVVGAVNFARPLPWRLPSHLTPCPHPRAPAGDHNAAPPPPAFQTAADVPPNGLVVRVPCGWQGHRLFAGAAGSGPSCVRTRHAGPIPSIVGDPSSAGNACPFRVPAAAAQLATPLLDASGSRSPPQPTA